MSSSLPDVLDSLQMMLQVERDSPDLTRLDSPTIEAAREELVRLSGEIRQGHDYRLLERYDAIEIHLGTLITFRTKKMMENLGAGSLRNATDEEAVFYQTLEGLLAGLRRSWGLPD